MPKRRARGSKRERTRYGRYAKATFRKARRLNIRQSSKDLEAIPKRALAEGLPYQTLISSLRHASGRLKEVRQELRWVRMGVERARENHSMRQLRLQ